MTERRGLKRSQLIATGIGVMISAIFIVTLVFPQAGLSSQIVDVPTSRPAEIKPDPVLEGIESTTPYIHSTGLFQSYNPANHNPLTTDTGFTVINDRQVVVARFRGNSSCSVIHFLVETNSPYSDINALNNALATDYFADAWATFGAWELVGRDVDGERIVAEFDLHQPAEFGTFCPSDYKARSISWLANGLIHHVRIVVRQEEQDSLDRLERLLTPTLITYPNNIPTIDNAWRVQTSDDQSYFMVLPPTWVRTANSTNTRLVYSDNIQYDLTIEKFEDAPLADEAAARTWVTANTPANAEVLSVETVNQSYAAGYLISYRYVNIEGENTSGIFTLLNDADSVLYTSNVRVRNSTADWLSAPEREETNPAIDVREVAGSLTVSVALG